MQPPARLYGRYTCVARLTSTVRVFIIVNLILTLSLHWPRPTDH